MSITGNDLIGWGFTPGPAFKQALAQAKSMAAEGRAPEEIRAALAPLLRPPEPPPLPIFPLRTDAPDVRLNVVAENAHDAANLANVTASMRELVKTPTILDAAVMPDACPAGPPGTIPVGGVAAAKLAIHPGMHSADICCSVMMTDLGGVDPKAALDAMARVTHFGQGGRSDGRFAPPESLMRAFAENSFLKSPKSLAAARNHLGTQGDGNHFAFVGVSEKTGSVRLVTHHGSRGPGALLYKAGMAAAEGFRAKLSPETLKDNAWIPFETAEGQDYWAALQLMRAWTKLNHEVLHEAMLAELGATAQDRFWNEHNFVFQRGDVFYHGKGATPAWSDFAADSSGLTLIPLNMAAPVLVARGLDAPQGLGFSPHGAGRNWSRSEHLRRKGGMGKDEMLREETQGLDVRFFSGRPDASELPSAYKPAEQIIRQIEAHGLAKIVDRIQPYGCMMAGETEVFWRKKDGAVRED